MGDPVVVELVVSHPQPVWTFAGRGGGAMGCVAMGCVRKLLSIRKTSEFTLRSFMSEEMNKWQNPVIGVGSDGTLF